MPEILTVLRREFIYLWYCFSVQLEQIFGGDVPLLQAWPAEE